MNKNFGKGFTLIELLVVIAIIGIMSSIIYTSLSAARSKARDSRKIADLREIRTALELYYDKYENTYPPSLQELVENRFLPSMPKPPFGTSQDEYSYAALGEGEVCSSYHLGAALENRENASLTTDVDDPVGSACAPSLISDFDGNSLDCGSTDIALEDNCYDLRP